MFCAISARASCCLFHGSFWGRMRGKWLKRRICPSAHGIFSLSFCRQRQRLVACHSRRSSNTCLPPRGDEHCNFGLVCVISGRASIKMRRRRRNSAALRVHKRRVVLLFARLRPTLICIFLSLIIEGPKGPELTPQEVHTKVDMIIGERLSNT